MLISCIRRLVGLSLFFASLAFVGPVSAFELFLPPGATLEQVSNNTDAQARYIGYPQISGDGRVVYYVADSSATMRSGHDLIRWERGIPPVVVMALETQQFLISVSRPSTNFDGSLLAYASRVTPDGMNLTNPPLYLYEHGVGVRELFRTEEYPILQPMMSPDGYIYFSSEMSFGDTNPRNEMAGFRYDFASGQVSQVIHFPAVSQGNDPNHVSFQGVGGDGRSLVITNGNFDGTNPQNDVSWRILDGSENVEIQRLPRPFFAGFQNTNVNLTSAMSVDGRYALYIDADEELWRYDAETGQSVELPVNVRQRRYVMSGNGRYLYFAHRQSPVTLDRLEIETGVTERLLTQAGEIAEWYLATDYSGNRVAFLASENLTGTNPNNVNQVYLLTLVPEPAGCQLLIVLVVCGVTLRCGVHFCGVHK
ncbi:MAG: hypothetical protein WD875_03345 [Pirellulales bacterium]